MLDWYSQGWTCVEDFLSKEDIFFVLRSRTLEILRTYCWMPGDHALTIGTRIKRSRDRNNFTVEWKPRRPRRRWKRKRDKSDNDRLMKFARDNRGILSRQLKNILFTDTTRLWKNAADYAPICLVCGENFA